MRAVVFTVAAALLPLSAFAQQMDAARVIAPIELAAPALVAPKQSLGALRVALPPVGADELEGMRAHNAREKLLQVGFARPLSDAIVGLPLSELAWTTMPDGGLVAAIEITSPDAAALRIALDRDAFPAGLELRTYAAARAGWLHGRVDAASLAGGPSLAWLPEQPGEAIGLELSMAPGVDIAGLTLPVTSLMHLVVTPREWDDKRLMDIGKSGSCNIDVACADAEWMETGDAVAKYIFSTGPTTAALCTGTLINNVDGAPRFISARHCLTTQDRASSATFYWHFERATCGGADPASIIQTTGGAQILATVVAQDMVVAELNSAPPASTVLAGWNANTPTRHASVFGIHHPGGDLKKWSAGGIAAFTAFSGTGHQDNAPYLNVVWTQGTTEQGSSGSALFNAGGQVLGTLRGGAASCSAPADPDYYGRLDLAYDTLWQFMGGTAPTQPPPTQPPPAQPPPSGGGGGGGGHGGLSLLAALVALIGARRFAWTTRSSSFVMRSGRRSAPMPN